MLHLPTTLENFYPVSNCGVSKMAVMLFLYFYGPYILFLYFQIEHRNYFILQYMVKLDICHRKYFLKPFFNCE